MILDHVKTFVRDVVNATAVAQSKVAAMTDPIRILAVSSQVVGSCDTIAALLLVLKDTPLKRFSIGALAKVQEIRHAAIGSRTESIKALAGAPWPDIEPQSVAS